MIKRATQILIPVLLGLTAVALMFKIESYLLHDIWVEKTHDSNPMIDKLFFEFVLPILAIVATVFQFIIIIPLYKKFRKSKKILKLRATPFTGLVCLFGGLIFGFILWETKFGIMDLIIGSVIGIVILISYFTTNLLTLKLINKSS